VPLAKEPIAVTARDLPFDLDASPPPTRVQRAARDLIEGFDRIPLWRGMALQDIKLRYRGSLFGPFWLTLSAMIMIGAMGVIYPRLFHTDIESYLPFLATGIVVWQFVSAMITEACQTFFVANDVILQLPMPYSVHVYRVVARNFIVFAHNFVILPIILVIFHVPVGWSVVQIIPALLLLALNGVWFCIAFGVASVRFRDIPPIIANVVQVLFFITPIFWSPDSVGPLGKLLELNPLFAAIDVIRAPLLGQSPAALSWPVLIIATALGCGLSFAFFARFRSRIPFWV
jgi:ABC-2 type transport system permease protein/lipopolysaccharide transport system permease protein